MVRRNWHSFFKLKHLFRTIGIGFDHVRSRRNQVLEYLERSRIILSLFNIESPNSRGTFTPTLSAVAPNMTSLSTSGWKL